MQTVIDLDVTKLGPITGETFLRIHNTRGMSYGYAVHVLTDGRSFGWRTLGGFESNQAAHDAMAKEMASAARVYGGE